MANGNGQTMGEAIFALLKSVAESLLEIVEQRFGIVRAYIEDVRDNIRFEDSRVDAITFLGLLDAATGAVTMISPNAQGTARVHPEYLFAVRRVHGLFNSPSTMSANIALVEATIREDGRGIDMLNTPLNLASIVPGTGHDRIEWETPYVFRDAAEIKVTFSLRPEATTLWQQQDDNRIVGIVLVGDLIRKKILP